MNKNTLFRSVARTGNFRFWLHFVLKQDAKSTLLCAELATQLLETDQLMGRPTAKTVHKAWGRDRSLQIEQRDGVDYDGDEGEGADVRGRSARTRPRAWEPRQAGDLLLPQEEASGQERKLLESTRGNQEGG